MLKSELQKYALPSSSTPSSPPSRTLKSKIQNPKSQIPPPTMLTPEQIKNLKPGDPLVVQGIFSEVYADRDIVMQIVQKYKDKIEHDFRFFDPYSVSLPSEIVNSQSSIVNKYDPTRLFKEGDRVRVVEKDGRIPTCFPVGKIKVGDILTVMENEEGNAFIEVKTADGSKMMAPWFHLELITPVEESSPYIFLVNIAAKSMEVKDSRTQKVEAAYYYGDGHAYTFETAAQCAEAERDRLNAKYRKEQNND